MNFIRYLILVWTLRGTPQESLYEMLDIAIKSGRRCAYDLRHASDDAKEQREREYWREQSRFWLGVFAPDGIKNYRLQFHYRELSLESHKRQLREIIAQQNQEILRLQLLSGDRQYRCPDPENLWLDD